MNKKLYLECREIKKECDCCKEDIENIYSIRHNYSFIKNLKTDEAKKSLKEIKEFQLLLSEKVRLLKDKYDYYRKKLSEECDHEVLFIDESMDFLITCPICGSQFMGNYVIPNDTIVIELLNEEHHELIDAAIEYLIINDMDLRENIIATIESMKKNKLERKKE